MPEMRDVENITWKWIVDQYAALDQRRAELDTMQELLKRRDFVERHGSRPTLGDAMRLRSARSAAKRTASRVQPNSRKQVQQPANGRSLGECLAATGSQAK